jgi:hypothetical protein
MMNATPDVLKVGALSRPENQRCETDIIDPVVFTQKSARFVFPKSGILSSDSQLHISQIVTNSAFPGVDTNAFYPTSTGALAMIQRAYLTIGGKRVSDQQSTGAWNTWKRLHFSNDYRERVATPKQAGNDVFMGSASDVITGPSADAIRSRGFGAPYGVLGRRSSEYCSDLTTAAVFGRQRSSLTAVSDKQKRLITADENTTPAFMISLSQLIPALVGVNLPLFAIKEEVALVIEFAPSSYGHRFMWNQFDSAGNNLATGQNYKKSVSTIVEKDLFLFCDYLFYDDLLEEMEDVIMNKGGYNLTFDDLIVQQTSRTYALGSYTNDIQIPLASRKVKSVVVQKELTIGKEQIAARNSSIYNSTELHLGCEYQLKVDSKNVYSLPVRNRGFQKSEADQVEGVPLVLCDYLYTWKNQVDSNGQIPLYGEGITERAANSHLQTNEMASQNWIGIKLDNAYGEGIRVSNQPLIYTEKGNATTFDEISGQIERTYRLFSVVQKIMNIGSGLVTIVE